MCLCKWLQVQADCQHHTIVGHHLCDSQHQTMVAWTRALMEECITAPHNGVAWCKICLHKFFLPRYGVPPLPPPVPSDVYWSNLRSFYLDHLTGDHPFLYANEHEDTHLHVKEATGGELVILLQHYKLRVPEHLQDGSEEWPADLKLKWQHTVLLWSSMLQVSFDREHLATQRSARGFS